MRGSVYYQSAELTKAIFAEGAKKEDRIDRDSVYFGCVASYKSMETYRNVWNNLGNYLKEHWNIKDFEAITDEHISAYMAYKIEYYPSKQYLEKLSSAIGKLELALKRYTILPLLVNTAPSLFIFNPEKVTLCNFFSPFGDAVKINIHGLLII